MRLIENLNIFQDVGIGQCEGSDVFGLPQVPVQTVGEVHHVVLSGVDLSERRGQRVASPLKVQLLAAPLLLQLQLLLLQTGVPSQLGALGAHIPILSPQRPSLLPQKLGRSKEFRICLFSEYRLKDTETVLYLKLSTVPVSPAAVCADLSERRSLRACP